MAPIGKNGTKLLFKWKRKKEKSPEMPLSSEHKKDVANYLPFTADSALQSEMKPAPRQENLVRQTSWR